MKILGISSDSKTVKGEKYGVLTGICYLAPSDESGCINTCPHASEGCRKACLFTAGRGAFNNVKEARINKTVAFVRDRDSWMRQLMVEILALAKKAGRKGLSAAVRLNGTSDISWESVKVDGKNIMEHFPNVNFYDYTKNPQRMRRFLNGELPANYHLTFSRSEVNQSDVEDIVARGGNVAVVFHKTLPATYLGRPVINGDESDIRFNDPRNSVVGLVDKGKARKDCSGFVVAV
jgi:hypothetical protein